MDGKFEEQRVQYFSKALKLFLLNHWNHREQTLWNTAMVKCVNSCGKWKAIFSSRVVMAEFKKVASGVRSQSFHEKKPPQWNSDIGNSKIWCGRFKVFSLSLLRNKEVPQGLVTVEDLKNT